MLLVLAADSASGYDRVAEVIVRIGEAIGIAVLVIGLGYVFVTWAMRPDRATAEAYQAVRRTLGQVILLGLEILVAADLIRTVIVEPTLASVGALGLLVVVRTVLSWSITVELEGTWPWRVRAVRREEREAGEAAA